jgi:hypothetical protein
MKPRDRNPIHSEYNSLTANETPRVLRPTAQRARHSDLKSQNSFFAPLNDTLSDNKGPTDRHEHKRHQERIVWALLAVLAVLSCWALCLLWTKVNGDL